ncbi:MAG: MATE family efflux transporter, partial [Lachnospiraceae bacterium]|nr:MATE family efflux transporter [Lachnospiraceae bacterium]
LGNIVLDYIFVADFQWGVAGVAWATFLAQGVACVLALITLVFRMRTIQTEDKVAAFDVDMLKRISSVAVPSILQQSFISVGNIFVQSLVNSFGSSVIAGYSAAIKLNTFAITSFTTLGNGVSSFTAQNLGAGKQERVREGFRAGIMMAVTIGVPFVIAFFVFGRSMILLFMSQESSQALETGVQFLKVVSPFYFVVMIKLIADGVLRGAASMKFFMISTFSDLILRVALAYILSVPFQVLGVWMSWPVGWSVGTVLAYYFYHSGKWMWKKNV